MSQLTCCETDVVLMAIYWICSKALCCSSWPAAKQPVATDADHSDLHLASQLRVWGPLVCTAECVTADNLIALLTGG
jgi:hypothetical protein